MNSKISLLQEIREGFVLYADKIKRANELNLTDETLKSEDVYADICNLAYNWNLENLNKKNSRQVGVDLEDKDQKIIVQVTSDKRKQKVEDTIKSCKKLGYNNYRLIMLYNISVSETSLKSYKYKIPETIKFDPAKDTMDYNTILKQLDNVEEEKLIKIKDILDKQRREEQKNFAEKSEMLQKIIESIISIDFEAEWRAETKISFKIQNKIEYNKLGEQEALIKKNRKFLKVVEDTFQKIGMKKPNAEYYLLNKFNTIYLEQKGKQEIKNEQEAKKIFNEVMQEMFTYLKNRVEVDVFELEQSLEVLTVYAFIKCEIFENPEKGRKE